MMLEADQANPPGDMLVKVRKTGVAAFSKRAMALAGGSKPVAILDVPPEPAGIFHLAAGSVTGAPAATWLRVSGSGLPWDRAHALIAQGMDAPDDILAIEPDVAQSWLDDAPEPGQGGAASAATVHPLPQNSGGGRAINTADGFAWHLLDKFSGLAAARAHVSKAAQQRVLIAHLDTGYDPRHHSVPRNMQTALERNFTGEGATDSAVDTTPDGGVLRNRGHGTATIGLLAGGVVGPQDQFSGDLGGAPDARIMAVRVADSVVRFTTSTIVQGIEWAIASGAHVLSMSMGGLASAALADAVNRAYDAGLVIVTAAGNNFWPSPASIVYPARFRRVIAATGVMADGRAYSGLANGTMQGNHGPDSKMPTAVAGWTPNVPWPWIGSETVIDLDGAGTSAATPQVAAAAALWIAANWDYYLALPEKWMRVEAVRDALFSTAYKTTASMDAAQTAKTLGQGTLRAYAALAHVPAVDTLKQTPKADASWDWLKVLTGTGIGFDARSRLDAAALELELMHLAQSDAVIGATLAEVDPDAGVDPAARMRFLAAVAASGKASARLARVLAGQLRAGGAPPPPAPATSHRARKARTDSPATRRRLRVYAFDPSLAATLDLVGLNVATVSIPFETNLRPGPVGEYVEVVDVDPASDRFYQPVDLDDRNVLASDGLEPSEGNPRFHQQMVYAIAMKTIGAFEDALGRKALWAPQRVVSKGKRGEHYVQRLRIYPHALRDPNAYYSPAKVALLLGYFPATTIRGDTVVNGTLVFSCLSADIIAHEMTHALLDGQHRRYQEQSNPDVGAFHEGFADIIALFQHFTYTDVVAASIAGAHGKIGVANLLSGLARQFGMGTGKSGALRDYLDKKVTELTYPETEEVHARGSILVAAVYEAFLAIVEIRTGDLIQLATGGSGILPAGNLHPKLVDRLTRETCKVAHQMLRICVRALDYCPPVDITFGEYLRALLTSDLDYIADDRLAYRTAILAAFRQRNLLPENLRTVSIESLVWRRPAEPRPSRAADSGGADSDDDRDRKSNWLRAAVEALEIDWGADRDRYAIFKRMNKRCFQFWNSLNQAFSDGSARPEDFGLESGLSPYGENFAKHAKRSGVHTNFEVHVVRRVRRVRPDGTISQQIVIILAQRRPELVDPDDVHGGWFWFRGGATLIIDPFDFAFSYIITKNIIDPARVRRHRASMTGEIGGALRAQYFDTKAMARAEPFAMLHADAPGGEE